MSEQLNELGAYIEAKRPDCILGWDIAFDELNMDVTQANLPGLVEFIKSDATCRFSSLVMKQWTFPDPRCPKNIRKKSVYRSTLHP